jgi:hypothetical protein
LRQHTAGSLLSAAWAPSAVDSLVSPNHGSATSCLSDGSSVSEDVPSGQGCVGIHEGLPLTRIITAVSSGQTSSGAIGHRHSPLLCAASRSHSAAYPGRPEDALPVRAISEVVVRGGCHPSISATASAPTMGKTVHTRVPHRLTWQHIPAASEQQQPATSEASRSEGGRIPLDGDNGGGGGVGGWPRRQSRLSRGYAAGCATLRPMLRPAPSPAELDIY